MEVAATAAENRVLKAEALARRHELRQGKSR